ncbi:MAG: AraC family transcriptional regulator [Verrucomicrobiales bacterium]|nr:AraC family transcriptional regulator [Verrucomicrobiales bacterium]
MPPASPLSNLQHEEIESLFDCLDGTQFWIKDASGIYLKVNRAFQLNYSLPSREAAVGMTDFDLSPPWLAKGFLADDTRVLKGERVTNRIELVGGFDGAAHWNRTTKIPVRNRKGAIAATAGITETLPGLKAPDFPVPELVPALSAMQQAPADAWTNSLLAERVRMSTSAFERKFRKHLQFSPMQFLKRLRLAKAAAALIQSGQSISEIAADGGFSDQAHLTREFKKLFEATPGEWRKQHHGIEK